MPDEKPEKIITRVPEPEVDFQKGVTTPPLQRIPNFGTSSEGTASTGTSSSAQSSDAGAAATSGTTGSSTPASTSTNATAKE